jgi:hypothetical protein
VREPDPITPHILPNPIRPLVVAAGDREHQGVALPTEVRFLERAEQQLAADAVGSRGS